MTTEDKKKYSFIHALYMSFFSRELYQDVGKNWKGYGFIYLVFILLLYWAPETARFQEDISDYVTEAAPPVVSQVPTVTISRGEASIKEPVPYFINYPDKAAKDTPFIIIDTTGQFKSIGNSKAVALVTKTQVIFKKYPAGIRTFDLAGIDKLVIDQNRVNGWIELFRNWFAIILFPFVLFFSWLFHVTQVFLCAFIGTYYAKRSGVALSYQTLVRLAVISYTPGILFQALHSVLGIEFPSSGLVSFIIALAYLYLAVGANSEAG